MLHNTTRKSKAEKIADLRFQISDFRFQPNRADRIWDDWGLNENAD